MTKSRAPLSFSLAITTVCGTIGWKAAAVIAKRSVRTLRHWSDSDKHGAPTLHQAFALDQAYIEAGGASAPILSSYARLIEIILADQSACRAALADDVALFSREAGDAIGHCIQAMQPGASLAVIHRAILETEEADALFPRLLGRLKALLPGNGAGREGNGVMK